MSARRTPEASPEMSPRCRRWLVAIEGGWWPKRRIRKLVPHDAATRLGVSVEEWLEVIVPVLERDSRCTHPFRRTGPTLEQLR